MNIHTPKGEPFRVPSTEMPPNKWRHLYAKLGWPTFPVHGVAADGKCLCGKAECTSPGKHPILSGRDRGATTDRDLIAYQHVRLQAFNIGLHLGLAGLVVIDIDPRNGGNETMNRLERIYGRLICCVESFTGGGGRHHYFLAPDGECRLPSSLGPGVDVLHGVKYPVLPGSRHASGNPYQWRPGCDPWTASDFLTPLPDWILNFDRREAGAATPGSPEEEPLADVPPRRDEETPDSVARLTSALEFLSADVPYDEWRDVIFAIHSTCWDEAEEIARSWSQTALHRYTEAGFDQVWHSANADHPKRKTVASIFYTAKQRGWTDPRSAKDAPETNGDINMGSKFAAKNRGRFIYVTAEDQWYRFNGTLWRRCQSGEHLQAAKRVAEETLHEAARAFTLDPSDANRRRHISALRVYGNAPRLHAMLEMAATEAGMSVPDPTAFDADPNLIGVRNGVVDLRSGKLLPATPEQRISRQAGAAYDPSAQCPQWLAFLEAVFESPEIVGFVQRAVGYTLTGLVDEEKLFFAHGSGANGKSVFANVLLEVFGDYAVTVGHQLLARTKHDGEAARYKSRLRGARLALVNEIGQGDTWDDQRIKEIVSHERIPARELYHEAFEYWPSHKLWVRGNHQAAILDSGHAMWRRIVLIPFTRQFSEEEQVPDLYRRILATEREGILAWAIRGCLEWQEKRLCVPEAIRHETEQYREVTDIMGEWLWSCCEAARGERVSAANAYLSYRLHCEAASIKPPPRPAFIRQLSAKGHPRLRSNGVDYIRDLRLRDRSGRGTTEDDDI